MGEYIESDLGEEGGFRCPICKHLILQCDSDGIFYDTNAKVIEEAGKNILTLYGSSACPHLVYAYTWADAQEPEDCNHFLLVRRDYAKRLCTLIREKQGLKEELGESEIAILQNDISLFLQGKFNWGDRISALFANLGINFEELLSQNVDIYYDDHYHSGIHFAIEHE